VPQIKRKRDWHHRPSAPVGELVAARLVHSSVNAALPKLEQIDYRQTDSLGEPEANFIASDRRSRSSHPAGVPSDLPPRLLSFAVAKPSCQTPIRSGHHSNASNRSSKHTLGQAQPFSFQLAPAAAPP
jgi:hypothetical protein